MNLFSTEMAHGALVAMAKIFEPWTLVALSLCFHFVNYGFQETLM